MVYTADRLCAEHDHFSISVYDELLNIPIEEVFEHYFTDSVLFRDFVAALKMSGKEHWTYCMLLSLSVICCCLLHCFHAFVSRHCPQRHYVCGLSVHLCPSLCLPGQIFLP